MEWLRQPEKWTEQYDRDGYVVVENALDSDTLRTLRAGIDRIEEGVAYKTHSPILRRFISLERDRTRGCRIGEIDSDTISNIMELPLFGREFADLIAYPRVLDILEVLFGTTEFTFHNYKCICKMPGNKAPFAWHRDLPYLEHTTPNLITCMLCLDDMTALNGATVVCPGTHRIAQADGQSGDRDMDESLVPTERVQVICPAGSAVLFHVNVIHGGGPNLSDAKRRNVIGIWAGPNTYPIGAARYAYEFVAPRSSDPMRRKQIDLTFGGNTSTSS